MLILGQESLGGIVPRDGGLEVVLVQEFFDRLNDFFVGSGRIVAHIELDVELTWRDIERANSAIEIRDLESGWREWPVSVVPDDLAQFGEEWEDLVDGVDAEVGIGGVALFAGEGKDTVERSTTPDFEFITQMVD